MADNKDYTRRNRFNGKSVELTKEESEIHDQVFVHEALDQWDLMNKANGPRGPKANQKSKFFYILIMKKQKKGSQYLTFIVRFIH